MYTITPTSSEFVLAHGAVSSPYFIHDMPSAPADLLARYLDDSEEVFRQECRYLLSRDRTFTQEDAAKLKAMLSLLVETRKGWEEEQGLET